MFVRQLLSTSIGLMVRGKMPLHVDVSIWMVESCTSLTARVIVTSYALPLPSKPQLLTQLLILLLLISTTLPLPRRLLLPMLLILLLLLLLTLQIHPPQHLPLLWEAVMGLVALCLWWSAWLGFSRSWWCVTVYLLSNILLRYSPTPLEAV
eukprot:Rmarinus@m.26276